MTNSMASSCLRENVILTKIILTTDGTNECVKSHKQCQKVWHPILLQDHTYQCCWSKHKLLKKEDECIISALLRCKSPIWALNWLQINTAHRYSITLAKINNIHSINNHHHHNNSNRNHNIYIVIPYNKELSESFKNVCSKVRVQVHLKGGNTIKNFLVASMDGDNITQKSEAIYRYICDKLDCDVEDIGKSVGTFGKRLRVP